MKAIFYSFSKRSNSTKKPTIGTELEIVLKAPTSIHNPRIRIAIDKFIYNYMYIPEFNTYYKVNEVISVASDVWEVSFQQDFLTTFRADILNGIAYIDFAGINYDSMIPDSRCARHDKFLEIGTEADIPNFLKGGGYLVTVLSKRTDNSEFTTTYLLSPAELQSLGNYLMDTSLSWSDILKIVNNPIEAILRVAWVPFYFNKSVKSNIIIGTQDTGIQANKLSQADMFDGSIDVTIPWKYNDFRRYEPYSNLSAWLPYYGPVSLNTSNYVGYSSITAYYSVDVFNGDITIILGSEAGDYRQTFNYNVAVDIPVAQLLSNVSAISSDIMAVASGSISALSGLSTGNYLQGLAGGITAGAGAINAILDLQTPTKAIKGSIQGRSLNAFKDGIVIFNTYYTTDDPNAYAPIKGRPVCEVGIIGDYLGSFVQTHSASIVLTGATAEETEAVNRLLDSGIYLE